MQSPERSPGLTRLVAPLLALAALWPSAAVPAQELLEEVLVTGEQPGPAMWKVKRGDHTLWIVGTLTPLPSKMTWRSQQVEDVISRSGEILGRYEGRAKIKGGNFAALRFLPAIMRLRFNADGRTLREVLPPEVYARWSATHRRVFGHDPDPKERARPFYAADLLFDEALEKAGLSEREAVWPKVDDLARRHKVRIRQLQIELPVDDPKGLIRDFAAVSPEKETACLVATLDRIDQDLPNMRRRAQAWAVGDAAVALRRVVADDQETVGLAIRNVLAGIECHGNGTVQVGREIGRIDNKGIRHAGKYRRDRIRHRYLLDVCADVVAGVGGCPGAAHRVTEQSAVALRYVDGIQGQGYGHAVGTIVGSAYHGRYCQRIATMERNVGRQHIEHRLHGVQHIESLQTVNGIAGLVDGQPGTQQLETEVAGSVGYQGIAVS